MNLALIADAFFHHGGSSAINTGDGSGLIQTVIYLIIIGLIFWAILWFVNWVGVPEPFNKVIRVVLGLFALLIIINVLLGLIGRPMFNW